MGLGFSRTKKQTLYQNQNGNIIKAQVKTVIQGPGSNRYGKEYALQFDNEYHDEVNTCVQIATANLKKRAASKKVTQYKHNRNIFQKSRQNTSNAQADAEATSRARSKPNISSSNMRYIQEEAAREAAELERTISAERKRTHTRRSNSNSKSKYSHRDLVSSNKSR